MMKFKAYVDENKKFRGLRSFEHNDMKIFVSNGANIAFEADGEQEIIDDLEGIDLKNQNQIKKDGAKKEKKDKFTDDMDKKIKEKKPKK